MYMLYPTKDVLLNSGRNFPDAHARNKTNFKYVKMFLTTVAIPDRKRTGGRHFTTVRDWRRLPENTANRRVRGISRQCYTTCCIVSHTQRLFTNYTTQIVYQEECCELVPPCGALEKQTQNSFCLGTKFAAFYFFILFYFILFFFWEYKFTFWDQLYDDDRTSLYFLLHSRATPHTANSVLGDTHCGHFARHVRADATSIVGHVKGWSVQELDSHWRRSKKAIQGAVPSVS
jgi:hypothetical protein